MNCLLNMCYVCLEKKDKSPININSSPSVNEDIIHIIGYLPCNLSWLKTKHNILICEECCRRLRETYQFLIMCDKNSAVMQGYMAEINTANISNADNAAELRVEINNKQDDIIKIKCEIKSEDEEIYTFERGPSIEESDELFVNVEDSFVKEEDTWKREAVDDEEEPPKEISVNSNADDTDPDGSGFTSTQGHTTNETELTTAGKKSHKCPICGKFFRGKSKLQTHTRIHTGEKPYKCATCNKCFTSKSNLMFHTRTHSDEKPYACATCHKSFRYDSVLVRHMRVHGEKPYECGTCNKCFASNSNLTFHMRTHSDENPYACTACDKSFRYHSFLVRHMRVHTCEKPYKCATCNKCFARNSNLMVHMRIHSDAKPYKCTTCNKTYRFKADLVVHMRVHTGEKPNE